MPVAGRRRRPSTRTMLLACRLDGGGKCSGEIRQYF